VVPAANVTYPADLRELAERQGRPLVTIDIDLGDGPGCYLSASPGSSRCGRSRNVAVPTSS
jgi:hypothetical protein